MKIKTWLTALALSLTISTISTAKSQYQVNKIYKPSSLTKTIQTKSPNPNLIPKRIQVRKHSTPNITFNYEIRAKNSNSKNIESALDIIENFPDAYQKWFNKRGGKIIFYEGKLTNLKEFQHLKKIKLPDGRLWDNIPGIYYPHSKLVAVPLKHKYRNNIITHELTHAITPLLFPEINILSNNFKTMKSLETIAIVGSQYFYSDKYRNKKDPLYNKTKIELTKRDIEFLKYNN